MNIALITAGGLGERCGTAVPKQFSLIEDKPLIIYTLEQFQRNEGIEVIAVSCLEGWEQQLWDYAQQYGITKLKHIAPGGATNQESICNGIMLLNEYFEDDDIVLVHDAARPLVTQEIINDCLRVVYKHGNAIASIPCLEPLLRVQAEGAAFVSHDFYPREGVMRAQAPQGFRLGKLTWAHQEAAKRNITNTTASSALMQTLGETLYCSMSSTNNIKITTPDDIKLLKAWL